MMEFDDDLLQEFLDGTLDEESRREFEARLASSPALRARLAEMEALFAGLETLPELPLPADLSAGVVAQIQQEAAVLPPMPRWLWGTLLGQAVLALLLLGSLWASLLGWLENGRQLATGWLDVVRLSTETFISQFWVDLAALLPAPALPNFSIDLPAGQWALLLGLALLAWLAGNRLLFNTD